MFNKEMNSNVLKPETLSFEYCEAIGTLVRCTCQWGKSSVGEVAVRERPA